MEYNLYSDPSLFAATPPLEAMRYLIHRAATNRKGKRHALLTMDVKRAYFNSEVTSDIFIEIPAEDRVEGDEGKVGKLRLCLYGTRDAAYNWSETVARQLESCGYVRGKAYPAVYLHPTKDVAVMVHGDDYLASGPSEHLRELKDLISRGGYGREEGMAKRRVWPKRASS